MWTQSVILFVLASAASVRILLLYSSQTLAAWNPSLASEQWRSTRTVGSAGSLTTCQVDSPNDVFSLDPAQSVVLDYTSSEALSIAIEDRFRDSASVVVMRENAAEHELRVYGRARAQDYGEAFAAFAGALGFAGAAVLSDLRHSSRQYSDTLVSQHSPTFSSQHFLIEDSQEYLRSFVGKTVKFQGINFLALFLPPTVMNSFVQALQQQKMYRKGLAVLLEAQSALAVGAHGLLAVTDRAAWAAADRQQYEYALLADQLETILEVPTLEAREITARLRSRFGSYSRNVTQVLVNFTPAGRRLLTSRPDEVQSLRVLFPGNSTDFPTNSKASIPVSVNYNGTNADGSYFASTSVVMAGVKLAFEEVNNNANLLANFRVEDRSEAFATVAFDASFAARQIAAARERLGIAYIPFPTSGSVQGTYETFRSMNISMPMTSGTNSDALSSKAKYPLFVRVTLPNSYFAMVIARMFKFYGWTKCSFLYANDPYGSNLYAAFLKVAESQNIDIVNPQDLRSIPSVFTEDNKKELEEPLLAIRAQKARIIVIVSYFNEVVLEKLYDMGARMGDYLFVFTFAMTPDLFAGTTDNYRKRREIANGSIQFTQKTFYGLEGERVRQALIHRSGYTYYANTCFFYDSAKLLLLALDYLLRQGLDFESPPVLAKAMRETVFTGCSGFVQIDPESNDRAPTQFDVVNFEYHKNTEGWNITYVGEYNPFSTLMFNFTKPIAWPDGSARFPDEKPRDLDCPFYRSQVQDFPKGKAIGFVLCCVLSVITGAITFLIWRRWWDIRLVPLNTDSEIVIEDILVLGTIVFDFFQLAAMGPDVLKISSLLVTVSSSTSLNVEELINLTNGVYWYLLDGVFAMVGAWVVLCVYHFCGLEDRCAGVCLCRNIAVWSELLMPTLGNILFLPIVSTLLSAFLCYQSIGPSFDQSFLVKDCYEFCWQPAHIAYVTCAGTALLVYVPLAIFSRPLWQELQPNVHVKALPLYLMVKSVLQVTVITLALTLKKEQPLVHGIVFSLVLVAYLLFQVRFRPFNYER